MGTKLHEQRVMSMLRSENLDVGGHVHRYPDGCCAVVIGIMRGPKGHSKAEAVRRYMRSGCIVRHVNKG